MVLAATCGPTVTGWHGTSSVDYVVRQPYHFMGNSVKENPEQENPEPSPGASFHAMAAPHTPAPGFLRHRRGGKLQGYGIPELDRSSSRSCGTMLVVVPPYLNTVAGADVSTSLNKPDSQPWICGIVTRPR